MVALAETLDNYNEGLLTPNCAPVTPSPQIGTHNLPTSDVSQ
jgi:hypothetical protein